MSRPCQVNRAFKCTSLIHVLALILDDIIRLPLFPVQHHYYQPMWTLVGAGIKQVENSSALMKDVLPSGCHHYEQRVQEFNPEKNTRPDL
ncbi:SQOR-like protein [Mya arenaria]|uniref:SQOR-like protein n=1 Tax=Mya arenaria TaxID=6604 RepID=A0ABY7FJM6_MYAAR|nr:SQOR-like protein [Mya arenaria]